MPTYGTPNFEYFMRLDSCPPDEDGPFLMVNFMKYRERAEYSDGSDHGLTGRQADETYAPLDVLADIGANVCFIGDVIAAGPETSTGWDRVGIVRYPSRRAFIDMQSRPDFQAKHVHKEAGMERTIVFAVPPAGVAGAAGSAAVPVVFDLVRCGAPTQPASGQMVGQVEGTIVGDGRVWTELRVTWTSDSKHPLGDNAVEDRELVVVEPTFDLIAEALR